MIPSSMSQREDIMSISFHKPPTCPAQVPRGYQQVSEVVNRPNILSCTITCVSSPVCSSVVFNRVDKTCHLCHQVAAPDCINMENSDGGNVFLEKKHLYKNGGTPLGDMCECVPVYIGQTCELGPMRDCSDYFKAEQVPGSTIGMIRPTNSDVFPVNCFSGKVTLKNGTTLFTAYNNIMIKNEKSLYQLGFDSNQTILADDYIGGCLFDLRGANFSTYDNDGDNTVNCAGRHQGGWWFRGKTCSTCNPTGQLLQPASGLRTGVDSEVFWIKDLGDVVPYKICY